jgi:hypothetical protein
VVEFEPPKANEVDATVPKALSDIAARAMEKNPEDRYRSARALSRELRHWLEEHAQETADPAEESPAPAKRPIVWALGAVAAVFVAAAAWWALTPHHTAPEVVQAAPPAAVAAPPVVASAVVPPPVVAAVDAGASAAGVQASAVAATPVAEPAAPALPPPVVEAPRVAQAPAAKPIILKETPKERRAREARERESRLAASGGVAATGVLRLAVSPWGQVEVDGKPVGTAPPLNELTLSEGRHTITIRNDEFPPYSSTVNIVPGQPISLKHRFGS